MRTLRLTIDDQDLDMSDAKVNYTRTNPMFEIVGSHTLPFKIIRNDQNDQIMKSNSPAALTWLKRYSSTLNIGPFQIPGEFIRMTTNDLFHEGYFTSGISTFREMVRGVKLSDIDYTETIPGNAITRYTDTLTSAANSSYPTYKYTCFPMLVPSYYDHKFSYNDTINPWSYFTYSGGGGRFYPYEDQEESSSLYAPSFYLNWVIQKLFDDYGYVLESNALYDDTELRTLVIANFNTKGEFGNREYDYELILSTDSRSYLILHSLLMRSPRWSISKETPR